MSIVTINVEMQVPKEAKEIVDAVFGLVEDVLAKKDIGTITAENLPALMTAIDGYDQVMPSVKSEYRDELVGYLVQQAMAVLLPYKEEIPAAPAE